MLILLMLLGAFRPPKPENRISLRYALDGHATSRVPQLESDVSYLAQLLLRVSETMALEKSPCYRLPHGSELSQPI